MSRLEINVTAPIQTGMKLNEQKSQGDIEVRFCSNMVKLTFVFVKTWHGLTMGTIAYLGKWHHLSPITPASHLVHSAH